MYNRLMCSDSYNLASITRLGLLAVSTVILLSIISCRPQPTLSQPVSPPQSILDSPLIGRWRLTDVTVQGEVKPFDLFEPIYLGFGGATLYIKSDRCGYGNHALSFPGGNKYHFGESMYTANICGSYLLDDPAMQCQDLVGSNASAEECDQAVHKQFSDVSAALRATDTFEVTEDTLILRGDEVELRLVRDEPQP